MGKDMVSGILRNMQSTGTIWQPYRFINIDAGIKVWMLSMYLVKEPRGIDRKNAPGSRVV